jgi:glycosyltransferase involved in cell wall biosynthesis
MENRVSILIPVYNREEFIQDAVASASNQTYKNIEIIIVDNQSTDNTWEILKTIAKADPRVKLFRNETNIGPVKNWKRCIEEATGKYGKILWSDDLIAPDFLEKTISFFNRDDVGFVFTGTEIFFEDNSIKYNSYIIGNTGVYNSEQYIEGVLFDEDYPASPGCALFRLNDLNRNLQVDIPNKIGSDFSMHAIGPDLLFFLLTAHQYDKFAFVNEKLSFFRAHKKSISLLSSEGKLALHRDIVKAFFVEKYRKDLIPKLNAVIWLHLKKYPDKKVYNLNSLKDFYMENGNFNVSLGWLIITKIQKKVINFFRLCKKTAFSVTTHDQTIE